MPEKLAYSLTEAAELLGVSRSTLHRAVRAGAVPHVRIGRRIVIPAKALEDWLSASATETWRSFDDPKTRAEDISPGTPLITTPKA